MTLRIHFTADDLARTRLAPAPRPLLELEIAVRLLQERSHPVRFDAWRNRAARHLPPQVRTLCELIPATGAAVDFLDLSGEGDPDDLLDRLRCTSADRVRKDLRHWASGRPGAPSSAVRSLGQDPSLVGDLADTVSHAHRHFIAPYWSRIDRLAQADRTRRLHQLAGHGVERLLSGLNPRHISWSPPVLHLTMASGRDADVHLGGRGLLLIPTLFGSHYPALDDTAEPQPWITYPLYDGRQDAVPAVFTARALTGSEVPPALTALLGRTRATVLRVIGDHPACTTGRLAAHARISLASASEHATVLRRAGLTAQTRDGKSVLHTLTPAGRVLLDAGSG
ncbi:winged helix-turn-helix domain-containing protein [Streptomyces sp. NPDC093510]|uniref:ArsR/SmtB family transcription factor n=1 Tax=Streptomyces sp. NPDC093510 TaxID=3155199 RepID=UPI0034279B5D